jgi:hypothetical protein
MVAGFRLPPRAWSGCAPVLSRFPGVGLFDISTWYVKGGVSTDKLSATAVAGKEKYIASGISGVGTTGQSL